MSSVVGWTSLADIERSRDNCHTAVMMGERFEAFARTASRRTSAVKWVAVAALANPRPHIHEM